GFVGSDLLAGLLALSFLERAPGTLFLDFGTNTEMALWDGSSLLVSSAAGGPAFEGNGLRCGMPAEAGAIHAVALDPATGELSLQVLAGAAPAGICGSGLLDLVACLLRAGKLTSTGSFAVGNSGTGFPVAPGPPAISLQKQDIDVFQRAKGAVLAGIKV